MTKLDTFEEPVISKLDIIKLPVDEQAKYADPVVLKFANDEIFCERQIKAMESREITKAWLVLFNTTSYGNMAYLSLHAHPKFRERFLTVYSKVMVLAVDLEKKESVVLRVTLPLLVVLLVLVLIASYKL